MECKENIFEPVEDMLSKRFGFQAEFKHIIIGGLCKECRDNNA
jgi:Fe2+ or Zn2+ uptake regulation protein